MTDDSLIPEQPRHITSRKVRDTLEVEIRECRAKRRPLAEDRAPGEPRLETFEAQLLEQSPVVGDRAPPFRIVIRDVQGIVADPKAATKDGGGFRLHDGKMSVGWCAIVRGGWRNGPRPAIIADLGRR